jgi:UDP-N-acetyl-D-mannosaminuronic acid transferase (WecB/TagA/CpsF family)
MSNHSSGPWRITDNDGLADIIAADGTVVVWTVDGAYGSQIEANARLIAAAPDLLVACERALEKLSLIGGLPATVRVLQEAISKAKGED